MLKDINTLHKHCIGLVLVMLIVVPFLTGFDIVRHVTVKYDGQSKTIRTNAGNPEVIIKEAGVTLETGDGWKLNGANRNVQDGSIIEVIRGKSFIVVRNNEEKVYKSSKATVGEALKSIGISYRKSRVYPNVKDELQENMKIYVLNNREKLEHKEADVEPQTEYVEDFNLPFGQTVVKSEGKPGRATVTSKVSKSSDGSTITQEIGSKIIEQPENRVVLRGAALSVQTPEGYKRYKKKMVVEASAYTVHCGSGTGRTSIGLVPYEGIVAVDPRVIPYYTKMYIPGYGIAMAGDTGGSIVGNKIDLYMNDWHKAIQWGRRDIEIYILED